MRDFELRNNKNISVNLCVYILYALNQFLEQSKTYSNNNSIKSLNY
jgi:hypothetical protein